MIGYIYVLRCPITNQIRYVGQTRNPKERKRSHRSFYIKGNNYYQNWKKHLKKINLRPIFEIIDEVLDLSFLDDKEKYWIKFYKSEGCNIVNSNEGGNLSLISENHNSKFLKGKNLEDYYGIEKSIDIKSRISSNIKAEKNPNYKGKHCTDTWKKNQSISQSKKPILVLENDIIIGEFINSKEASIFLKCSPSTVREAKRNHYLIKKKYKIIERI